MITYSVQQALTAENFWDYSVQLYSQSGVMEACLNLQDEFQLNVNLLLFCCYLDSLKHPLLADEIEYLLDSCKQMEAKIETKRAQRRIAKSKDKTFYQALKEEELLLERQQQSDIIQCMQQLLTTKRQKSEKESDIKRSFAKETESNLYVYLQKINYATEQNNQLNKLVNQLDSAKQLLIDQNNDAKPI